MEVLPIYELPFDTIFFIFMFFGFFGWCSEVIYVGVLTEHKFVNRGFLFGPICPIYGFGGVVILTLPKILYSTWIPLFLASMLLCSAVEYFASWILEKTFHTLWWDYSHYKVNLNGRICLLNAILFGGMGVLSIHFIMPYVMLLINKIGDNGIIIIARIIGVIFAIDMGLTIKRLVDYNATMTKLHEFRENIKNYYENEEWFHGETLSEMISSIKDKAKTESSKFTKSFMDKVELMQQQQESVEKFIQRFPNLKSKLYNLELIHIKTVLRRKKLDKNQKE